MDLGIEGRSALVVGGGGGLGGAICHALASEGARVAVADLNSDAAASVAEAVSARGGDAFPLRMDIGELGSFEGSLKEIGARQDEVEILVNLTGGPPPTLAGGVEPRTWSEYFQSMVLGVIHLTDVVLPAMRARGFGRIITSASSGVITPIPNLGISNALRMSLLGWSKTLAGEVAADGVTVNIVVPGRIATGRIRQLDEARAQREGKTVEEATAASHCHHSDAPLRRANGVRRGRRLSGEHRSLLYHGDRSSCRPRPDPIHLTRGAT